MELNDQELLRYSRQIFLSQIDIDGQIKLKQARVLIVGLGGLGSPAALYLAAAGVGHLSLADFDVVDETNLQRQIIHDVTQLNQLKVDSAKARLKALNPLISIQTLPDKLHARALAQAVQQVDVVLDCSDNFATREAINQACFAARKPLVSGAAIRLSGQVAVFDFRHDGPCYQCLYGDGEDHELTCSEAGVLGPLVGVIGSLQALETIKLLADVGTSLMGRLLIFDALNARFKELRMSKDPQCKVCGCGQ